jgi:hypothetical protein
MKTGTRLNCFFKSGFGSNSRAQGFRARELNGLLCVSYLLRVVFPLNPPASKFLCFIFTVFGFSVLFAPKAQSLKLNLKVSCSLSSMYFGCVLVRFMALVCFCLLVLFVYYLLLFCCTILSFLRFSGFSNGSNVPNIGSTGNGEMECIGSTSISKVHTTYNKTNKKICKHKSCRNMSFVGKEWKILENSKAAL